MRQILLLLLLFHISFSFAQIKPVAKQGSISGVVYMEEEKRVGEYVSVRMLNGADSTFVKGASTGETGEFVVNASYGQYILEFSSVGLKKLYREVELKTKSLQLDTVYMQPNIIELAGAEVVADIPAIQVKGDTIEFNAGAYSTDGSSVLKDLIGQIAGLEISDEGVLKANGKVISKILLDGKEYFGNDISMALSTLPATMITKLQLFEKESEEAKASGIKDDEPEQVLNVGVKEEFKKSVLGDTKSGVGNKGRYINKLNSNRMYGDNQYSLVGGINNIDDSKYGMHNSFDDNLNKDLGINFNIQESEKITFNGSASYDNYKTWDEYRSDSYSSVLKQYTNRESKGIGRNQRASLNGTMDWKPDILTTVYLRLDLSYGDGDNTSISMDSAHIVGKSRTSTSSSSLSKNNNMRVNSSLMLSRKLNDRGRNITLTLSQSYNNSNSKGQNYSEKIYWGDNNTTDIIDHRSKNDSKNTNYGLSARYVEPLDKDNRLHVSYSAHIRDGDGVRDVRKLDPLSGEHTLVDSAYSRNTDLYSLRQNIRLGFQRTKEKYNLNINFSANPSYIRNKTFLGDSIFENPKQNVLNYSPSIRFTWKMKKDTRLELGYNGSTNHPSIAELSADTVIHSASSKTVGNPKLKPSYTHRADIDFRKSDLESGQYFSVSASYSYTSKRTVGYQTVDDHSNTINTYRNVDGNTSAYGYLNYNTPLKNKKINVGGFLNLYYSKNIGFINEKKRIEDVVSISPSIYGRLASKYVDASLNFYVGHRIVNNNLSEVKRSNNTNYRLTSSLKLKLPLDFTIESKLNFSYRTGLQEGIKKHETMWNLSASKLLLKEKRGTLKFEFFDVLNDFRTQDNTVSGSDYSNSWRGVVNNYFVFSFGYRFQILGV